MELAAETTSGLEAAGVLADGEYEPPALFIFSTTTHDIFFLPSIVQYIRHCAMSIDSTSAW